MKRRLSRWKYEYSRSFISFPNNINLTTYLRLQSLWCVCVCVCEFTSLRSTLEVRLPFTRWRTIFRRHFFVWFGFFFFILFRCKIITIFSLSSGYRQTWNDAIHQAIIKVASVPMRLHMHWLMFMRNENTEIILWLWIFVQFSRFDWVLKRLCRIIMKQPYCHYRIAEKHISLCIYSSNVYKFNVVCFWIMHR